MIKGQSNYAISIIPPQIIVNEHQIHIRVARLSQLLKIESLTEQHQPSKIDAWPRALGNSILTSLFRGIEDVGVTGALNDLLAGGGLQGDLESHDLEVAGSADLHRDNLPS